jgi:alpha-tubulin suppressor-like RCC1 family protein
VVGGHRFTSLALGAYHTCGIADDERALCWGWNVVGQLGNGGTEPESTPTPVSGDHRWRALSLGNSHSCGLTTDGALYCWGSNARGQFGNGTVTEATTTPLLIDNTGVHVSIVAGGHHTCGLTADGSAFCWGRGDYGQLGNGERKNTSRPAPVLPGH